MQIEGD